MAGNLKQWVGDNVLQLLGASDSTTVDYFIALGPFRPSSPPSRELTENSPPGSKAKTPAALFQTLSENGLPQTSTAHAFATELHARAPRKASTTSAKAKANADDARRKLEKERADMQKQRFSLVMDDDVPAADKDAGAGKRLKRSDKGKGKSLRKTGDGDAWESDEEERAAKRRREDERERRYEPEPEGEPEIEELPSERAERLRLEDIKERDDFAARMKDRDKDKTKKLIEDRSSSKVDAESIARRALAKDPSALQAGLSDIRDISRQSYLAKREQQQLDLLRIQIADDERDFRGIKLTRREIAQMDKNKELLRLAEERLAVDEGFDGYQMPDGASPFAVPPFPRC